jgi:hypothetical protein
VLQQLSQTLAASGASVALPITSSSFEAATAGQSLSNTGELLLLL